MGMVLGCCQKTFLERSCSFYVPGTFLKNVFGTKRSRNDFLGTFLERFGQERSWNVFQNHSWNLFKTGTFLECFKNVPGTVLWNVPGTPCSFYVPGTFLRNVPGTFVDSSCVHDQFQNLTICFILFRRHYDCKI